MAAEHPTTGRQHILLTGRPGVGKTTVIMRLAEHLRHLRLAGFYTDEIRRHGQRQRFRATTFSGGTTILAHVKVKSRQHVGRYGVNVTAFEQLVLPELARPADLLLIDEIGKMECFSSAFVSRVGDLLQASTPVVATVALAGGGFIAEVKRRADQETLQVTRDNRDELPQRLAEKLSLPQAPE